MTEPPLPGRRLDPVPEDPAAQRAGRLLRELGTEPAGTGSALTVSPAPGSGAVADWAASGAMALTGRPDGPPLVAPGAPATAARAALLALDALAGRRVLEVDGHLLLGERAALAGLRRAAPWSAGGACRSVRAADGWVVFSLARPEDDELLPALVEGEAHGDRWDVVTQWCRGRSAEDVVARAQLLGLVAARVPDAPTPVWPPWRITSSGRRRPVPHREAPLVVDLSTLWAGPLCASLLGAAGAQVVRVESLSRPDGGRRGTPAFDDLLHAGQPSVALPFDTPDGLARLRALVGRADVVVTSARPRALRQLGLDPSEHLAGREDAVWVAVTAHPPGPDGTVAAGYGDDAAVSAGLVRHLDGVPVPCGDALADPLTGLHAAVAALACLQAGGTHLVEVALSEVARSTLDPSSTCEAERDGDTWTVEGVPVAAPRARTPSGRARPLGADTADWT
ncbi:MAG: hypothetical protein JWM64_1961 [Frankiales bacterium]|nr:hypothetical protein [Frankiales bacterium]